MHWKVASTIARAVCSAVDFFHHTGRVLLADNHLSLLQGVHSLLDALFKTVLMVADERSLMEAIAIFKPDLVVVDLSLRGEGEANVARRLMERHPDLRLIVLSVHDEPTVATLVKSTGAAGFVLKRRTAADLHSAIHEVLRGGTYISPSLRPLPGDEGFSSNADSSKPEE
jgi:DNA-binding NarL/FixJ family response regulator